MPLLPLLAICQFLPYQHVFGVLQLVNRHFYTSIRDRKVKFLELKLKAPSVELIRQLDRRIIINCTRLILSSMSGHRLQYPTGSGEKATIEIFLRKLIPSVTRLQWKGDTHHQPIVMPLINGAIKLTVLEIDDKLSWDLWNWSLHTINPSVKTVIYHGGIDMSLPGPLHIFPGIEILQTRRLEEGLTQVNYNNLARIEHLEIERVRFSCPPLGLMLNLTSAKFGSIGVSRETDGPSVLNELTKVLRRLARLRNLELKIDQRITNAHCVKQGLQKLSIYTPNTLENLAVFIDCWDDEHPIIDPEIRTILQKFPNHINTIKYQGEVVR